MLQLYTMNIRHLCLLLFCWSTLAIQAQPAIEIPENQQPLITKISASWCPKCGSWGWDLMEGLIADNRQSSSLLTIHYSGNYKNDVAVKMATNFDFFGQPQFFINSQHVPVSFNNTADRRVEIREAVARLVAQPPLVQTGILAGTDDEFLHVATQTRFFQDTAGDYRLGIYLVERRFVGYQSGHSNADEAEHKNLLRMSLTEGAFGEPIATGAVQQRSEMGITASIALADLPYALDNIQILTIIWKAVGDRYEVINTNSTTELLDNFTLTDVRRRVVPDFTSRILPNVVAETAWVHLSLPSRRDQIRLELWSADGRRLQTIYRGGLAAGEHRWPIYRADASAPGLYFLRIDDGRAQLSRRLIFQ